MIDKTNKSINKRLIVYMFIFMLLVACAVPLQSSAEVVPTDYVILIVERPEYSRADIYYGEWGSTKALRTTAASNFPGIYKVWNVEGGEFYEKTFSIVQIAPSEYENEAFEILTSTLSVDDWVSVGLDEYYEATGLTRICNIAYSVDDVSVSPTPTPSPTATPTPTPTNTPIPTATNKPKPTPTEVPVTDEEGQLLWFFDMILLFFSIKIPVFGYSVSFFQIFLFVVVALALVGFIYSLGD